MDTQHVVAPIGHYQSRDLHSINVYSFIYVFNGTNHHETQKRE